VSDRTKLFLITAAFSLLISQLAFASEAEDLMKQGNQFYQDKDFDKAVNTYQHIINLGYSGMSLYYNLGNAYYREGKVGYAILYYEKALELSPGDGDVIHNLAIANTKTVDKIDTMPKFFLFQWWESILALLSVSGWTYAVYLFYLLLLVSIGLFFFSRGMRIQRYSVFSGLVLALLLIITATIWVVSLNREFTVKNAIVVDPAAAVKLAPDSTSNDAFVIHEGLKVRELDRVDNWIKIRLQDGKEGWIQQDEIGAI